MRIIDLYNMVANKEQPKKFKYQGRWFAYSVDDKEFRSLKQEIYNGDYPEYIYLSEIIDLSNLNDKVEMIDDYQDYEINKIKLAKLKRKVDKAIEVLESGISFCENDSQGLHNKCNISIKREKNILKILKDDLDE